MKVGMIQSNYLPWRGYFDFIDDVDLFIFYDDVQYTHRDWRNRNRIKLPDKTIWLSVPVVHCSETLVQNAKIDYQNRWVDKHIRSIALAYQKTPHYQRYAGELFDILNRKPGTISALNVSLCRWAMDKLQIKTRTAMSSEFGVSGTKYERPLAILKEVGATSYLSGPTARPYTEASKFAEAGIQLEYKAYEYKDYPQPHGPFESSVAIIDLLFNCGEQSRSYLKSLKANDRP